MSVLACRATTARRRPGGRAARRPRPAPTAAMERPLVVPKGSMLLTLHRLVARRRPSSSRRSSRRRPSGGLQRPRPARRRSRRCALLPPVHLTHQAAGPHLLLLLLDPSVAVPGSCCPRHAPPTLRPTHDHPSARPCFPCHLADSAAAGPAEPLLSLCPAGSAAGPPARPAAGQPPAGQPSWLHAAPSRSDGPSTPAHDGPSPAPPPSFPARYCTPLTTLPTCLPSPHAASASAGRACQRGRMASAVACPAHPALDTCTAGAAFAGPGGCAAPSQMHQALTRPPRGMHPPLLHTGMQALCCREWRTTRTDCGLRPAALPAVPPAAADTCGCWAS